MAKRDDSEFYSLIGDYVHHPKVQEMKLYKHHGIQRYDHCFRVAYHSYKVTKFLHLNYRSATKAAFLHDFWTDELDFEQSSIKRFRNHPSIAAKNAKTFFSLNELEKDIIECHMFPITFKPPRYIESWIVDIIDDIAAVYEGYYSTKMGVKSFANFVFILFLSIMK